MTGSWAVVYFNACPLLILGPLFVFFRAGLRHVMWPTVFAASMIGAAFTLYANGLVETTIIRATMLYYLTPVWSTLLGVLWLSEKLTIARVVAIAIAFVGLYLLLVNSGLQGVPPNIGDLYSLLSGIFWAVAVAALNRWPNIPILPLTAFIFVFTTIFSFIFAGAVNNDPLPEVSMLQSSFAVAAFWSVCVLLPCFCIIFRGSQILFPGRVGILTMSEVIVAIVSATVLVPEERMVLIQWVGGIAIITAGLIEVLFGYSRMKNAEGDRIA